MMQPLNKRWQIPPKLTPEVDFALFEYPPVLRQILFNRGHHRAEVAYSYLHALPPDGTDPFILKGIPEAVERILFSIQKKEPVAIYGDYDADGVTATALLVHALRALNADVCEYIPNRFDEGYGLNKEALNNLHDRGIRLVISVDCGIRSNEEADYARQLGLDLIITDHHQPKADIPQALAVINPKQIDDLYPEKGLAGVGLAYKLTEALIVSLIKQNSTAHLGISALDYLDLVALGTVADLAPLKGENRTLVRSGLTSIRQRRRQGIASLIGASGLKPERITSTDIGFALGPRLNAAGRLDSALAAFELLTSDDPGKTGLLAQKLEAQNRERQQITRDIQAMAEQIALIEKKEPFLLFAAHPDFNPGVVGLAASRLTDLYYRPAIVAYQGETFTRASCRSIAEFNITQALDQCTDLLERYGGHAAAAGFTVRNENLPELLERLQGLASEQLSSRDLRPILEADAEVTLSDLLYPDLLEYLDMLQPTGQENSQAVFVTRNLKVTRQRTVGKDDAHLKLTVTDGKRYFDAIAFRQGHWAQKMPPFIDLMYVFETNEYNGGTYLQLNVRDIKLAGKD
ncbi:MAG: single-stranded-DNA-specific exonuclease RecJ [Omnitrophica WOR_2 bacterium]